MSPNQVLQTAEQLELFGQTLVDQLRPGRVLVLDGPMGAGKTTLVKGIARGLGFAGEVTSPTYTYIHPYPTPQGKLVHIDAYRLEPAQKLWGMGLDELLETARLGVIEWGKPLLAELENPVLIELEILPEGRKITITGLA